jgi:hypothetical protein
MASLNQDLLPIISTGAVLRRPELYLAICKRSDLPKHRCKLRYGASIDVSP